MARGKGEIKGWITKNGVHIPIYDHYTVREGHEPGEKGFRSKFNSKKKTPKKFELKHEVWHEDKEGWSVGLTSAGDIYVGDGQLDSQFYKDTPENRERAIAEWKANSFSKEITKPKSNSNDIRKSIEKDVRSKMENYWKNSEYKDSFVKSDVEDTMGRVDRMLDYLKGKNLIEPGDNKDIPNEIKWKFSGRDKATGKRASFEFSDSANVQKAKETLRGNGYTVSTGKIFPVNIYNALADTTNMDSYDVRAAEALTKAALSDWKKQQKGKK